jgi:hypothetical protein
MNTIGLSSFPVAAYALSLGHNIQDTSRSGRRVTFIFQETEELRQDLDAYKYGNPSVAVRDYEASQSRLKNIIFEDAR